MAGEGHKGVGVWGLVAARAGTAPPALMRRTASLDALSGGKWLLSGHHHDWGGKTAELLLLQHKNTQTPAEWQEDCPPEVAVGWSCDAGIAPEVCPQHHHHHASITTQPVLRRHSNPSSPQHFPPSPTHRRTPPSNRRSPPDSRRTPPDGCSISSCTRTSDRRRTPNDRRTPDGAVASPSPSSPPPLWQPSCLPLCGHTPTALPAQGEHLDKFIRQRLQQQSHSGCGGGMMSPSSARQSPVPADHSLALHLSSSLSAAVITRQNRTDRHLTGRSGGLAPLLPRPLLPRFRGSVEGLNQEIEGLVLRAGSWDPSQTGDEWLVDGRRAPLPDYFLRTRSVDTQTTPHSPPASPHSLPSPRIGTICSPVFCGGLSPCPDAVAASAPVEGVPGSPVGAARDLRLNTSPHINKFLAREPPTGSQRVALKANEERWSGGEQPWQQLTPSVPFTLRPSLGSAFCPPQQRGGQLREDEGRGEAQCAGGTTPHIGNPSRNSGTTCTTPPAAATAALAAGGQQAAEQQ